MDALDLLHGASGQPPEPVVPGDDAPTQQLPTAVLALDVPAAEVAEPEAAAPGAPLVTVAATLGHPEPQTKKSRGPRFERPRQLAGTAWARVRRPEVAAVVVTGFGVLIVLVLGYVFLFTPLSAARAQHTLLEDIPSQVKATYNLAIGKIPPEGTPVAVLEIPALHLHQAVVQGTSAQDLRLGPGHMPGTSLPGQPGNAVLAGRRATYGAPFGAIGSLKAGDHIVVVDGLGSFTYRVTSVQTVSSGQPDVVTPTGSNRLTLVTAGSGLFPSGRLAVLATLVGHPVTDAPLPAFRADPAQLGLAGDPIDGLLAVVWGALFLAVLTGAVWLLRNWPQPVVIVILATPLLVAAALFACQSVVGFLPATQ